MFSFTLITLMLVAGLGILVKYLVDRVFPDADSSSSDIHIDWKEYAVALTLMCLVITPVIYFIGGKLSLNNQLRYEEFYNGVETRAVETSRTCVPGHDGGSSSSGRSNCHYTYVCGSYSYLVTTTSVDADGNATTSTHLEFADIECPHLKEEFTYTVFDSLPGGVHQLPGVFGAKDAKPWDSSRAIPASIPLGPPQQWLEAKQRIEADDPRPVTRLYEYKNYILAAQEDLLLPYVEDIDRYIDAGLMPDHTENIGTDPTYGYIDSTANKLSFVGVSPANSDEWQEALNGFNGALGMTLRGDMHMVVVDAALVDSKVQYTQALKAYWVGEHFGRRAVAKNAIIVALGVRGDEVVWAEATTGMPYGNSVMLEAISTRFDSAGVPFTPQAVIGNPRLSLIDEEGEVDTKLVLAEHPGIIEEVVLRDFPFVRASMECSDEDDGESCLGFGHLVSKLEPSRAAKLWMGFFILLVSSGLWASAASYNWSDWISNPAKAKAQRNARLIRELYNRRKELM